MPRTTPDLYAAEFRALGEIFAAEIENRLPFQSRKSVFDRLAARGLIERRKTTWLENGMLPIQVSGWYLTELGRMKYCARCAEQPETVEAKP